MDAAGGRDEDLQGWTDVTVTHFRDLGVYGEQLLLSIRYGDWIDVDNEDSAKNWARYHKDVLYGYWHAYRAATGVDLTNPDTVDATLPAIRLQRRLEHAAAGAVMRRPGSQTPGFTLAFYWSLGGRGAANGGAWLRIRRATPFRTSRSTGAWRSMKRPIW